MQNETKKELHTQMWKIENPKDFTPHDREVLEKAAAIIRAGGLVAFPTETVYGLGANALDEAAAKKIYAAKGRPSDNPLIAHVSCLEEIAPLVSNMPENGKKLAKAYWPGPMTMVFPKSAIVPYGTTGGLDTVAIRMPSDPIAAELIRLSGVPIAAPSANTSGRPSPTRADHVLQDMDGKIDAIIDGGPVGIGLESTIVDVTEEMPMVLRPGAITVEMLRETVGKVGIDPAILGPVSADVRPKAPGMKYRHYAPRGQVYLAQDADEAMLIAARLAAVPLFLVSQETATQLLAQKIAPSRIKALFADGNFNQYAQSIFAALRDADSADEQNIVVETVPEQGLGLAIMNRLKKAAAK